MPSRSNSRTKVAASRRRSWTRSSSPSSKVQPTVPNDVRAWASAYRSAGGSSKPTGEPSSRRVRVPGEGPRSESSSAPQTPPRSRRSIDRGREHATALEPAALEPEGAGKSRRPTTILLVEDNPDSLRALSMSLSLLGYEVRPANSLRTALAAAENGGYDLIFSDLELGDGTGLDLLRSMGPGRSVPAIALTGYGSEEDRKMCLEAGFETHLIKPVETRQLDEAIRSIIAKTINQLMMQTEAGMVRSLLERLRLTNKRDGFNSAPPHRPTHSGSPTASGLLRPNVLALLGHRPLHERYQNDQTERQNAEQPEDIEVGQ